MAGWLAVWNPPGRSLDPARWATSVEVAAQLGTQVHEYVAADLALVSWARSSGEFSCSGRLFRPDRRTRAAWIGQCLTDEGDASAAVIGDLARPEAAAERAAQLNGQFALAVLHTDARRVTLWTDRHAHYPVYLLRGGPVRAAATDVRCLVPWLEAPRLDRGAVDLLLRVGELVGRRTLLVGLEFLPGGTCWSDEGGRVREQRYWQLRFEPDPALTAPRAAEELALRLTAAVRRAESATARLGVTLSGGLDSRLLLGLCRYPADVPSFTWGRPGCRDIRCAAAFARRVRSPHTVRLWSPEEFPPLWVAGVARTAGAMGVHEMYMLPFVDLLSTRCDAVLNGLAGDALLGGNFIQRRWLAARDSGELADLTWRWRVAPTVDTWADRLAPDAARSGPKLWRDALSVRTDGPPAAALQAWLIENRVFRFTNCGTQLLRGGIESHAPFFDRDVIDLLTRVPLPWRYKHRLYLETLRRACPEAARVRWQRTGLPPAWGYWPNLGAVAVQRAARHFLGPLQLNPFRGLSVADPAGWLRGPWRDPAAAILLAPQTLERGLFEPDAVRAAWETHQRGADLTRLLGVLLAIELFARQTVDSRTPATWDEAWIAPARL